MNKIFSLLGIALIIVTGAAAVGLLSGSGTSAPAQTAPATAGGPSTSASVPIAMFSFTPVTVHVGIGAQVTWTNLDSAPHTATADQGASFDTGTLMIHQTKTITFSTAGTFTYHCAFHPFMHGTVTVK